MDFYHPHLVYRELWYFNLLRFQLKNVQNCVHIPTYIYIEVKWWKQHNSEGPAALEKARLVAGTLKI